MYSLLCLETSNGALQLPITLNFGVNNAMLRFSTSMSTVILRKKSQDPKRDDRIRRSL